MAKKSPVVGKKSRASSPKKKENVEKGASPPADDTQAAPASPLQKEYKQSLRRIKELEEAISEVKDWAAVQDERQLAVEGQAEKTQRDVEDLKRQLADAKTRSDNICTLFMKMGEDVAQLKTSTARHEENVVAAFTKQDGKHAQLALKVDALGSEQQHLSHEVAYQREMLVGGSKRPRSAAAPSHSPIRINTSPEPSAESPAPPSAPDVPSWEQELQKLRAENERLKVNKKQKKSNAGPSNSNPRPTQGRAPEGSAEEKRRQIVAAKKRLQADEAELKQLELREGEN